MQKYEFSYDKDNDDLFLYNPKSKSKGSVELGDLILDYSNKGELVGIQILNASEMIKYMIDEKDSKLISEILSSITESKIDIKTKNNILIVRILLFSKIRNITPVISVPRINESSPSLAYA